MKAESKESLKLRIRELEAKFYHYSKSAQAEIARLAKENSKLKNDNSYGKNFRKSCLGE